jgi:hypothetical protein
VRVMNLEPWMTLSASILSRHGQRFQVVARAQGPPAGQRFGKSMSAKAAAMGGSRKSRSAATSTLSSSASSRFFPRNACHCICFCVSCANSSVRPNGTPEGSSVLRRSNVAAPAAVDLHGKHALGALSPGHGPAGRRVGRCRGCSGMIGRWPGNHLGAQGAVGREHAAISGQISCLSVLPTRTPP